MKNAGQDEDASKAKRYNRLLFIIHKHLYSSTWRDTAPQLSQKETKKDPLKDKGVRLDP